MGVLSFRTHADYSELVRLREEVKKLKADIRATTDQTEIERLNGILKTTEEEFERVAIQARETGSAIEQGYKNAMEQSSKAIEDLTEDLTEQKKHLDDLRNSLMNYQHQYDLNARNGMSQDDPEQEELLNKIKGAKEEISDVEVEVANTTHALNRHRAELAEVSDEYNRLAETGEETSGIFDKIKGTLSSGLGLLGIGTSVVALGNQVIQTRKEFQAMETSIQTLLGSKEKTDELLGKVKQYAAVSPLELSSISSATQMMLGFNLEAEEVPKYISAIGDVSMGEAGKFNSLTLAFSQMSATGKLMGQDLNQMINAGFNPLSEISRTTGKSVADLKEQMSKGAISAKMVQDAFISATSAGGKFHNMSQESAKTIGGQMSMLQDSIDAVFNSWGEASEGIIVDAISLATKLIENYKTIGAVIATLVSTYGAYRGALLANIALQKLEGKTAKEAIKMLQAKIATTKVATTVTKLFNNTLKANPLVLFATTLVGVTTAIAGYIAVTDHAKDAEERFTDKQKESAEAQDDRIEKAKELIEAIRKEKEVTEEVIKSHEQLMAIAPELNDYTASRIQDLTDLTEVYSKLNEAKKENLKVEDEELRKHVANAKSYMAKKNDKSNYSYMYGAQVFTGKYSKEEMASMRYLREKGYIKGVSGNDEQLAQLEKELNEKELETNKNEQRASLMNLDPKKRLEGLKALIEAVNNGTAENNYLTLEELEKLISKTEEEAKAQISAIEKLKKEREELAKAQKEYKDLVKNGTATETQLKSSKENVETHEKRVEELEKILGIDKKEQEAKRKEAEQKKKEQKKRDDEAEKMIKDANRGLLELQEDSHNKRVQQIENNYNDEIERIRKKEEEWEKEQKGILTVRQQIALEAEKATAFEKRQKSLADEVTAWIGDVTDPIQKYQMLYNDMLTKKQEFTEAFAKGEITEEQRNIGLSSAEATFEEESTPLEEEIASKEQGFTAFVQELERITLEELENMLRQAELQLITMENTNDKDGKKVALTKARIEKLREQINSRNGEAPNKRSIKEWMKLEEAIRNVSGSFKDLGEQIGGTEGEILSSAGTVLNGTLSMINSIQQLSEVSSKSVEGVSQKTSKAIQAVEKASVILNIIGMALQLLEQLSGFIKSDDEKWEEQNNKTQEVNRMAQAVRDYEMAVLKARQAEKGWFSQSGISSLSNDYEKGQKALENYYGKANEMQEAYKNKEGGGKLVQWGKKLTGFVADTTRKLVHVTTGGMLDKVAEVTDPTILSDKAYRKANGVEDYVQQQKKAIDNLRIETKSWKKGFLGIGARSQKTESVQEWMEKNMDGMKLFDEDNMIDIEAATLLLEQQGDKLVGNTKETIEQLIEYKKQYDEWVESLRAHVSDMYSPLVDSMTDAIMTWLETGEDALKTFKDSAGETFRAIVSDMIKTMILSNVVGTFQDDIAKLYEGYMKTDKGATATQQLVDDVNKQTQSLMGRFQEQIPALQAMTDNINKTLLEGGIDILGSQQEADQEATYGGYETMSEETGTELSGRFSAMYIVQSEHLALAKTEWELTRSYQERMFAIAEGGNYIMGQSMMALQAIRENTNLQPKALKMLMEKLEQWDEPIKNLQ